MMKAIMGILVFTVSLTAATNDAIVDVVPTSPTIYEIAELPPIGEIDSPVEKINYVVANASLDAAFLRTLKTEHPKVYCAAVNTYFEARGEPPAGKAAVAEVVKNRTKTEGYPSSACGVIKEYSYVSGRKICQFSWFCKNSAMQVPVNSRSSARQHKEWHDSVVTTIAVMSGRVSGIVGRSTHFYNHKSVRPNWSHRAKNKYVINNHTFVHIK